MKIGILLSEEALERLSNVLSHHFFALNYVNAQDAHFVQKFITFACQNHQEEINKTLSEVSQMKPKEIETFIDTLLLNWDRHENEFKHDDFKYKHYSELILSKPNLILALLRHHTE